MGIIFGLNDNVRPPTSRMFVEDLIIPAGGTSTVPPPEAYARGEDHAPFLKAEPQRTDGDCGVACLTMLLPHMTYEQVEAVVGATLRRKLPIGKSGLFLKHLEQCAVALDLPVRRLKTYDLDTAFGILDIKFEREDGDGGHTKWGHYVILTGGMILDTNRLIYRWRDYERINNARFATLLAVDVPDAQVRPPADIEAAAELEVAAPAVDAPAPRRRALPHGWKVLK